MLAQDFYKKPHASVQTLSCSDPGDFMAPRVPPAALLNASSDVLSAITDLKKLPTDVSPTLLHRTIDYAVDRSVRPALASTYASNLASQAAFTPFKDALLLANYSNTKEALYELRDIIAAASKHGYKAPASHMALIISMLQSHEEHRLKLASKKASAKGKAPVRPLA